MKTRTWLIAITVCAIIFGGLGYKFANKKTESVSNSIPTGWITYKNSNLGFELSHPASYQEPRVISSDTTCEPGPGEHDCMSDISIWKSHLAHEATYKKGDTCQSMDVLIDTDYTECTVISKNPYTIKEIVKTADSQYAAYAIITPTYEVRFDDTLDGKVLSTFSFTK